jgi:hypothetical protein
MVLPEYFGFPLSISFYRCSITRKRTKNNHHRHLHHRVAQEASRLRCDHSVCCGALRQLKKNRGPPPPPPRKNPATNLLNHERLSFGCTYSGATSAYIAYRNEVFININFKHFSVLTESFISSFLSLSLSVLFSDYRVCVFMMLVNCFATSDTFFLKCTASTEPKQAVP